MHSLPQLGDTVRVWPAAPQVQDGTGAYGRFLAPAGRAVVWDDYWHRRLLDGSIHLHDPAPAAPSPAPKKGKE